MREKIYNVIKYWWERVDPYVIQGTSNNYCPGMVRFWWYGFFLTASGAYIGSYVTLYLLALGATSILVDALASIASLFGLLLSIPGAQWAVRINFQKRVVFVAYSLRYVAVFAVLLVPFNIRSCCSISCNRIIGLTGCNYPPW